MGRRKDALVSGYTYHVFGRSIAGYDVFGSRAECKRMVDLIDYYRPAGVKQRYSFYLNAVTKGWPVVRPEPSVDDDLVAVIAYCLMPTHYHLVLKQLRDNGITKYMNKILDSYSHFFNKKRNRKGPLWESKFKNVLVKTDEQLLHLTRYVHLNPTTASLVDKPEEWLFSSYKEYLGSEDVRICNYECLLTIDSDNYRAFVEDRIDYQRNLGKISKLLLD